MAAEVRSGRTWYVRMAAERNLRLVGTADGGGTVAFHVVSVQSTIVLGPPDVYPVAHRIAVSRSPKVPPTITAGPLDARLDPDERAEALTAAAQHVDATVTRRGIDSSGTWTAER